MKIYATCSLCTHFDTNSSSCMKLQKETRAMNQKLPIECVEAGRFVRNINVVLDSYHLYAVDEPVPSNFKVDLSRLPKDENGTPLFVMTKRGMERAVPAYPEIVLKGDMLLGVHKVSTYQGQRELISDLGVDLANEIAEIRGVQLVVLPEERMSVGNPEEIKRYRLSQNRRRNTTDAWLVNGEEVW